MTADLKPTVESFEAGRRLRQTRERQRLTLKRVEELSELIAAHFQNSEFAVPSSRLSDMETKGVVPSIFRLHSLARIYRISPEKILEWYGVLRAEIFELKLPEAPLSRIAHVETTDPSIVPITLDPSLDWNEGFDVARVIEQWGAVPFSVLKKFQDRDFLYGYVGSEDFGMDPILPPGSFVQIDPAKNRVVKAGWQSDYDRPIYAVETRAGLYFSWCSVVDRKLILEAHPLSKVEIRIFKLDEADVLGQVVGAAIRVGGQKSLFSIVRERR